MFQKSLDRLVIARFYELKFVITFLFQNHYYNILSLQTRGNLICDKLSYIYCFLSSIQELWDYHIKKH